MCEQENIFYNQSMLIKLSNSLFCFPYVWLISLHIPCNLFVIGPLMFLKAFFNVVGTPCNLFVIGLVLFLIAFVIVKS